MKRIVTIGGGGGHSQVLKSIKDIPDLEITGICPSTDSGGSTGILQREYNGSGYTGDLTKCILALCADENLAKALTYRYESGPLQMHSVKNLLWHALEKVSDTETALKTMWKVCGLGRHRVIPVTTAKTELCASLRVGHTIIGETNIDTLAKNPLWNPDLHSISDIYLKPPARVSEAAARAISVADFLIICPGDLYSSILPTLLPVGMKKAIGDSKARIVLILNIMTKQGETQNFSANDFIKKIEEKLGRKTNHILYNNASIPEDILTRYSLERKVELATPEDRQDDRIIPCALAMVTEGGQIVSNPAVIKTQIMKLLKKV